MSRKVWCRGKGIIDDSLTIAASDRGLTLGLGLFETILARDGKPVFLEHHVARLAAGCKRLGWTASDAAELQAGIATVLDANGLLTGEARVRCYRTAGSGALDSTADGEDGLTVITAVPLPPVPMSVSVTFSRWPRNERSALAGLKCASYAENLVALADAKRQGYDETYFLNTRGDVCETALANLFVVKDRKILTPPLSSGCLPGITRQWVLDSIAEAAEHKVTRDDLLSADEVFLTSATRGPVPVSRLDGHEYEPPTVALEIREKWQTEIARNR